MTTRDPEFGWVEEVRIWYALPEEWDQAVAKFGEKLTLTDVARNAIDKHITAVQSMWKEYKRGSQAQGEGDQPVRGTDARQP